MVENLRQFGIIKFLLICGLAVNVAAQTKKNDNAQSPTPEAAIKRVIVLLPARSSTAPQVQWRIDRERAANSKKRRKSRKRSTQARAAVSTPASVAPAGKIDNRTKTPEKSVAPGSGSGSPAASQLPGSAALIAGKIDVVPPEQRVMLAQALLTDALTERLQERLEVVVVGENETGQALQTLHLTPEQAMQPDNARRLCAMLNSQAILMPRVTACAIHEGAIRDAEVFADIRIANVSPVDTSLITRWPAHVEAAGTAFADRVLFHKQYKKPQGDLIRDAAQQTVSLLLHALRVGEQAPFMRPGDRIAVTPVLTPSGADKLIFTAVGRRVAPTPLANLHADVSALFLPDLLPIATDRVVSENDVRAFLVAQGIREASLWTNEDQPDLARVQTLGRSLHVEYALLTRVTDVELSESEPHTPVVANTSAAEQGRSARVEATAALVRVEDGVLLWHDRAVATMMASSSPAADSKPQTNQTLTRDAAHFALVELQRRLRRYRSTFER